MTFVDTLRRRGSGGDWHIHDASEIEGEATFLSVKVNNLLAGTIASKEIVIAGGADGILRSDNYQAGVDGWQILGDGTVELNDVTVRGDIISSNWDGADPLDLSGGADGAATVGYGLDASEGAAQFQELHLVGDDGDVMSLLPNLNSSFAGIQWLPDGLDTVGWIYMSSGIDFGTVVIAPARQSTASASSLVLDSGTPSGGNAELRLRLAGSLIVKVTEDYVTLPVKTTTGDPAGEEGAIYVNTFDNALRLYADAAWRSVVTW